MFFLSSPSFRHTFPPKFPAYIIYFHRTASDNGWGAFTGEWFHAILHIYPGERERESHLTVWGWPGSWRGEEGGEKEGSLFLFKRYQKHSQVSQSVAYERAELRVGVEDRCGGERRGEVRNINKSINIKIPSPRNAVM